MKKSFLFLTLNLLVLFLTAQITISNNDMPAVNDIYNISITTNLQGNNPALTGTNFLWDYSQLQPITQRNDTFVPVTSTPLAYQFFFNNSILYPNHKADYAIKGPSFNFQVVNFTNVFDFYKKSSSQYANVGFGANINGIPSSTRKIPVDVQYVFPLNYNNNAISNSAFLVTIPTIGAYGQTQERIDTVDGWGSVITPFGTFNCLRVKSILNIIDTLYTSQFGIGLNFPRPQQIEYKWLAAGSGVPVLKITSTAGASQIEYQDNLLVGIDEIKANPNQINLFPNPAKEITMLNFDVQQAANININIVGIDGKLISQLYTGKTQVGNNKIILPLTNLNLSSGIYFIDILINNQLTQTKKLILEK